MNYDLNGRRKDYMKRIKRSHTTGRGCAKCDYCQNNRTYQTRKESIRILDAQKEMGDAR